MCYVLIVEFKLEMVFEYLWNYEEVWLEVEFCFCEVGIYVLSLFFVDLIVFLYVEYLGDEIFVCVLESYVDDLVIRKWEVLNVFCKWICEDFILNGF